MTPFFLTTQDILDSHENVIALYGDSDHSPPDQALLESAVAQAWATFGGHFLHAYPFEMAAAYGFHICKNHPFVNGNKRTAAEAMLLFLEANGLSLVVSMGKILSVIRRVEANQLSKQELAEWLEQNSVSGELEEIN